MLNNMKIGTKLVGGFVMVALFAAIVGIVGIVNLRTLDAADTKMYEQMTVPLGEIANASTSFQRMRNNLLEMAVATNGDELQSAFSRSEDRDKEIDELLGKFEKTIITDEGKAKFRELQGDYREFDTLEKRYTGLVKGGQHDAAMALWKGEMEKARKATQEDIEWFVNRKIELAKQTSDSNTALANRSVLMMNIFAFLALVVGIVVGIIITRNVKRQLGGEPAFVAEVANHVAAGDLSVKIDTAGQDSASIVVAMSRMVDAIKALVSDAGLLSQAAVAGKLATRADATKHQGDFKKIVQGVNDTLDAVIGPLNVAAEYVDRISKGDIPPKISDNYNGDFNEIKLNLNNC
ncbi:MAG TPA: MCP four helix bundle domain-containing protein, partial [Geobacterales bacterium]|nr:MCP four helix bundle domain-containing protein [Geobacterales bacterium]